jgi:hypothetical protein
LLKRNHETTNQQPTTNNQQPPTTNHLHKIIFFMAFLLTTIASSVLAQPSCITNHTQTDLSSSLSAGNYYIDNDVYISSNIVITDAEIIIADNVKITIKTGASLTLEGVHLYSCDAMWKGIALENESFINCYGGSVNDNTLIEDADIAIKFLDERDESYTGYYDFNWALEQNIDALFITNTIFNRNRISIDFGRSKFTNALYSLSYAQQPYPIKIYNTIFTCRNYPFTIGNTTWDAFDTFKHTTLSSSTTIPNTPITNSSPYIEDALYSPTAGSAYLKAPYNSTDKKSEIGIYAESLTHFNGSYHIGLGYNGTTNNITTIFDNQDYGIKMTTTDLKIENCTFQITPDANKNTTVGVYVYHINETNNYLTTSLPDGSQRNAFFDCDLAIESQFYTQIFIEDNDIRSSKTQSLVNSKHGKEGIKVRTSHFGYDQLYNNTIYINRNEAVNIGYAINLIYDDLPWYYNTGNSSGSVYLANDIKVNNNWIALYRTTGTASDILAGYYTEEGIHLQVVVPTNTPSNPMPELRCFDNQIKDARFAIQASGWEGKDLLLTRNSIAVNSNTIIGYNDAHGILLEGNIPQNNLGNIVYANYVFGGYSFPQFRSRQSNIRLIEINNGQSYEVNCNSAIVTAKFQFLFSGINTNSLFYNNIMAPDFVNGGSNGYALNNGAIIGQQGNVTNASDNFFEQDFFHNTTFPLLPCLKALTINSSATSSPLYIQQGSTGNVLDPVNYSDNLFLGNAYSYTNNSLKAATNASTVNCSVILSRVAASTNNARANLTPMAQSMSSIKLAELENIALGKLPIANADSALHLYVAQWQLYRLLSSKNGLAASSNILQQFMAKTNSFSTMQTIIAALSKHDTTQVTQLLSNWQPTNRVDANYAKFFTWTLQRGLGKTINLTNVEWLAQQCPQTDGNVVFWAQNLYNTITGNHRHFTTTCDIDINEINLLQDAITAKKKINNIVNSKTETLTVYPNPATSTTTIKGENIKQILVFDVYGKQVLLQQNTGKSNTITLNTANLRSGMYIVKAYSNNGTFTSTKFVKQ